MHDLCACCSGAQRCRGAHSAPRLSAAAPRPPSLLVCRPPGGAPARRPPLPHGQVPHDAHAAAARGAHDAHRCVPPLTTGAAHRPRACPHRRLHRALHQRRPHGRGHARHRLPVVALARCTKPRLGRRHPRRHRRAAAPPRAPHDRAHLGCGPSRGRCAASLPCGRSHIGAHVSRWHAPRILRSRRGLLRLQRHCRELRVRP